jgi:hypothetical protein
VAVVVARRQTGVRRRGVRVVLTPARAGTGFAHGRLRRGPQRVDLPQVRRSVAAGRQVTLRLKPGPRGRALLRKAHRHHHRVRAKVTVVFVAPDGARTTVKRGGVTVG